MNSKRMCIQKVWLFIFVSYSLQAYRIFNTWLGDPVRLLVLKETVKVIKSMGLLDVVNASGEKILLGLQSLQVFIYSFIAYFVFSCWEYEFIFCTL